jgi:hypothetical protein
LLAVDGGLISTEPPPEDNNLIPIMVPLKQLTKRWWMVQLQ